LHAYTSTDGHDCNWQVGPDSSSPDGTSSAYFYTQTYDGTMPQADPSQGVNVSAIAGHNTLVIPQGTDGSIASCSVETAAKKWTFPGEWKGNVVSIDNDIPFVIEYPTINTHVVGDQDAACQAATSLASQIWTKIP
jgi:hypothetical protein